jgi:hypothetical protein
MSDKTQVKKCDYCKKGDCYNNEPFCQDCIIKYENDSIDSDDIGDFVYHQHYATY